jgi:hypothetical protein
LAIIASRRCDTPPSDVSSAFARSSAAPAFFRLVLAEQRVERALLAGHPLGDGADVVEAGLHAAAGAGNALQVVEKGAQRGHHARDLFRGVAAQYETLGAVRQRRILQIGAERAESSARRRCPARA